MPCDSTVCLRSGPNCPKLRQKLRNWAAKSPQPRMGYSSGCMAQKPIPGAPSSSTTPHLLCFALHRIAQPDA